MLDSTNAATTTATEIINHLTQPFNCAIYINKKSLTHYDSVELQQGFNQIPSFKIEVSYDDIQDIKITGVEDVHDIIGYPLTLQFYQGFKLEDKSNDFSGIVTHVTLTQTSGHRAVLIIKGQAKCCLLQQGGKHYRIYQEKSLSYIVKDIASRFEGDLNIQANPSRSHMHALISQYDQTDFEFLNYLSFLCGEWFYWNRDRLQIGKPEKMSDPVLLSLHNNLTEQSFVHSLQPTHHQSLHSYFPTEHRLDHLNNEYKSDTNAHGAYAVQHINKSNRWLGRARNHQMVPIHALFQGDIAHYQQTLNNIAAVKAYQLQGKSIECLLRPGLTITLKSGLLSEAQGNTNEKGSYLIQQVTHTYNNHSKLYSNAFTAVPNTPNAFPHSIEKIKPPQMHSQIAEVVSNPDPYGRVRVRMPWGTDDRYSPYLYAVQPELGTGTKGKKRGFYFLPRQGDSVVVDALHGNPNFLYISGAISHGKNMDAEGNNNNNIRWMTTDSGHTLVFNDNPDQWGITIHDDVGNKLHISTKDKKIHITAPEEIILHSKKITFNAEQDIQIQAGNNIVTTAKANIDTHAGKNLNQSATSNVHIDAGKIVDVYGKQQFIAYADGRTDIGAKDKMHVHSKKTRLTGEDKIEYKCSTMDKVLQKGEFKYTKEPTIISAHWMDASAENKISELKESHKASIYVVTRNTKEGDTVSLNATEYDEEGKQKQHTFSGKVEADGTAILKEAYEHKEKA